MIRNLFSIVLLICIAAGLLTSCYPMLQQRTMAEPFVPPFMVIGADDTLIPPKPGGVWYMLPQTRIEVVVEAKRTELVKGPYAAYASKYLGIDNVITNPSVFWQLEDIVLNTTAIPDPKQLYFVSMGNMDTLSVPSALQVNLNPHGMLTGDLVDGREYVVGGTFVSAPQISYSSVFKQHAESNLYEKVDTVIEHVMMDSVTVEKRVLRTKMVEKPIEQRAKETADLILKIREERLRLLTGFQEIPYDPVTIRYMVDELERIEREYIELFTGLNIQTVHSRRYILTPDQGDDCVPIPMMRFSSQEGLMPTESQRGEVLYIQCCSGGVNLNRQKFHQYHVHDSLLNKQYATGFVYRNPEWSRVSVFLGNRLQKETGIPLPQFGSTERLPWFVTRFVMDPETGAISSMRTE